MLNHRVLFIMTTNYFFVTKSLSAIGGQNQITLVSCREAKAIQVII